MFKPLKLLLLVGGLALAASPAFAVTAKTNTDAKFLIGPGKGYAAIGLLPAGAKVGVIWCGTKANYCLVEIGHRTGWVALASLKFFSKTDVAMVLEDGKGNGPSGPILAGPKGPVTLNGNGNTIVTIDDGTGDPQLAKPLVSDDPAPHVTLADPPKLPPAEPATPHVIKKYQEYVKLGQGT